MEKMENLLQQILANQVRMQGDISEMKGDITELKGEVAGMKGDISELKANQERFEKKLDIVVEQVADLNEFKVTTTDKLHQIVADVNFVKYKTFQNEKELFCLKEALKLSGVINQAS